MLSRRGPRRPYRPGHHILVLLEKSAGEELNSKGGEDRLTELIVVFLEWGGIVSSRDPRTARTHSSTTGLGFWI